MDANDRLRSRLQRITAPAGAATPTPAAQGTQSAADGEGRHSRRKSALILGTIVCADSGHETECTVQDISATGARAKLNMAPLRPFDPPRSLPASFRLIIPADGQEVDAELAWQNGTLIGIRFTSAFRPARIQAVPRM